jgi:formylmethanofuran dehydrogenase subunit E
MNIGAYSIEDYMHMVKAFHGSVAPGLLIGGFMVDLAMKNIPEGILFEAISETQTCLPDAIQLLTPCTIGNGWMKVMNFGRYAICLYDKQEGIGVRVFLDPEKLEDWSEIKSWFFKLKSRKEQDIAALQNQIIEAGTDILTIQNVTIDKSLLGKKKMGPTAKCPVCGEAYPMKDGDKCLACQGNSPYQSNTQHSTPETKSGHKVVRIVKPDMD